MNSDNLILRETNFSPLTNKNDFITNEDFDNNLINIYSDFVELCNTNYITAYSGATTYSIGDFAVYDGKLWESVSDDDFANVTPGTDDLYWIDRFPTLLAHIKNSDTILAEGTSDEVTASEIRAFIDAGLTSTTNLSVTENTGVSLKINSSTGTDVTLTVANETIAGLLSSTDKIKLNNLSGVNTGDQTLASLGAEAVANKATDFDIINDELYPTTEAVSEYLTTGVATAVESFIGDNYALKRLSIASAITTSRYLTQTDESKVIPLSGVGITAPIVITLPNNTDEEIAVGSQFMFYLVSDSATVTFAPQVESPQVVTLISAGDLYAMDTIGAVVSLVKVATNSWLLTGKLA
jgi:hypothetical protein